LYGKKIQTEILINIIYFLQIKYKIICKSICKSWSKILKSNLSKKILPPILKSISYCELIKFNFTPGAIARVKNHIYIINNFSSYKLNIKNVKLEKERNKIFIGGLIFSNDNYICIGDLYSVHVVYSLKMEMIKTIYIRFPSNLVIDNNINILIGTGDKIHIYNLEGKLIRS